MERKDLLPKLPVIQQGLSSIFNQDIDITYNLSEILKNLKQRRQDGHLNPYVPGIIGRYLSNATDGLEKKNFGNDKLLASSWLEAAPKGVLFEVVLKLKNPVRFMLISPLV